MVLGLPWSVGVYPELLKVANRAQNLCRHLRVLSLFTVIANMSLVGHWPRELARSLQSFPRVGH